MNFLCPSCQKMLTVPEQYAGQLMKCPMCGNTFTAPGLPATAPAAVAPLGPPPAPAPGPEVFALAPESPPTILPFRKEEAIPGASAAPAAPPPQPGEPAPPRPAPPPAGYTHAAHATLDPKVLPWVAPVALSVVFVLLFLSWVGMYPDGTGVWTQSAWGAAFGSTSPDPVWVEATGSQQMTGFASEKPTPGASTPLIFYLLVFLLLALPAAVLSLLFVVSPQVLPPALNTLKPWRALLAAGTSLLALLLLVLQLLWGFSLQNTMNAMADQHVEKERQEAKTPEVKQQVELRRGHYLAQFHVETTVWPWAVVLLHLIAAAGAGLDYWMERRGQCPPPRLELHW